MPKVIKKISVAVNKVVEKDLPFNGTRFESLDEVSTHPDCVGENDLVDSEGKSLMKGKQFSILGRINYAQDLIERSKVRPVWFARLEGPSKAFVTAAKAQIKLYASLGKELGLEEALKQVYAQMGVDPKQMPSVDKSTPVDYDTLGEDEETESEGENETEETEKTAATK